jgi:hypothetical protein
LGLYYIFWYGIRNSELNDFGMSLEGSQNPLAVSPLGAILAITLGAFTSELAGPRSLPASSTGSAT